MKKAISLLLALVLCLSLCACGDSADTPGTTADINNGTTGEVDNGNSENNNVDTSWLVRGETINVAKLRECVEIVELTTENWNEHFKVYSYSYTEEKVEKDAFGEVVSTETITHEGRVFGVGNERYHAFVDVAIEIKNKTTGELFVIEYGSERNATVTEEFDLDNYECTRIKGSVYYLNIPIGEIPVDNFLSAVFPAGFDYSNLIGDQLLKVEYGTNEFSCSDIKAWFS